MLCLTAPTTDVYRNLATEEYLLKHRTEDFFLLWQSDNAVVIGKNQNVDAEVDARYAGQHSIHIARRYSGGGTVYQDMGNFNLTFIESTDRTDFGSYADRIIAFLSSIGIHAQADERLGITVEGLKVSGSAQCVHKHRVMYHCTLLHSTDLLRLDASTDGNPDTAGMLQGAGGNVRAISSVHSPVANLRGYLPQAESPAAFKELIQTYFLHENGAHNTPCRLSPFEETTIEELRDSVYAREEWIFHRKRSLSCLASR